MEAVSFQRDSYGRWERRKILERDKFAQFVILTSTILSVLDSNLARMPPGETTPVIEQHLVEVPG